MFDFNNLSKTKQGIYNEFKLKFCGENSPLNTADCISKEDNLRNIFENNVNQLLRNLDFSKNFEIFKHETTNESGRTDCQYGNTIIEYKKYGLLDKTKELEKFQNQTQNYLKDSNFSGFLMYAFLFDGKSVYIYQKDENDIISFDNSNSGVLTAKNFDLMIKTIFMNGVCAISPENIKNDFGIIDINDKVNDNPEALNLAKYLFKIIQNTKNIRTNLIFKEWEKLFRLAESDDGKHQDIKIRRDCFSAIFEEIINDKLDIFSPQKIKKRFWDMFIVDTFIGNFDRHNGNWGFIYNRIDKEYRLAPVFDCGSCLFPKIFKSEVKNIINNQEEINKRIYLFPRSAIKIYSTEDKNPKINPYNFLLNTDNVDCLRSLQKITDKINLDKIKDIIGQLPIENELKKFLELILNKRKELILDYALKNNPNLYLIYSSITKNREI